MLQVVVFPKLRCDECGEKGVVVRGQCGEVMPKNMSANLCKACKDDRYEFFRARRHAKYFKKVDFWKILWLRLRFR